MKCKMFLLARLSPGTPAYRPGTGKNLSHALKILSFLISVTIAAALAGCQTSDRNNWRAELSRRLPAMGHRNWLLIADSAYPAQTAPGIEIILTREDHFTVLDTVLTSIRRAEHIRPNIYLDKELQYLSEQSAPGIKNFRKKLLNLLNSRNVSYLPHEELIQRLSASAEKFTVLVLKTDLTLPYTSVFIELDCGYWSDSAQKKLRKAIK